MGAYIPPSIRTVREDLQPTTVITGAEVVPLLIGTEDGSTVAVTSLEEALGASTSFVYTTNPAIGSITAVRSQAVGGLQYVAGTDYTFVAGTQTITFLPTALDLPFLMSATPSTTGGAIAAGMHFYVITAIRNSDEVGPVVGETTHSNEVQVTTAGATSSVALQWNPLTGAEGYKIYRTDVSGVYNNPALIATVLGGFSNTFVDTLAVPGAGAPPVGNSALRRPALNGGLFFTDYTYIKLNTFTINRFTDLGQLIAAHGLGSDLAVAGTLAMGTAGRGNGASIVLTLAIPDDNLATYQAAFDLALRRKDIDYIVPLNSAQAVATALQAHVDFASNVGQQREREGVVGVPVGTPIGDTTTVGTAVQRAAALNDSRMQVVYPWPFVNVQQNDGAVVNNELDGSFLAAAVAGAVAALADRATPLTTKTIFGITALGTVTDLPLNETEMNILGSNGVTVITSEDEGTTFIVRDHLTTNSTDTFLQHPSIQLTDDFLRKTLRAAFRDFRGRKLLGTLLTQIQKRTLRTLQSLFKLGLIAGFDPQTIAVVQDTVNPTQVDVRFSYQPVFPLRIIEFRYSFDLSTPLLAAA